MLVILRPSSDVAEIDSGGRQIAEQLASRVMAADAGVVGNPAVHQMSSAAAEASALIFPERAECMRPVPGASRTSSGTDASTPAAVTVQPSDRVA